MANAPTNEPFSWDNEQYRLDNEEGYSEENSDTVKAGHLFGHPVLAQELYDKGLLFALNHNVLHHHGYAIGVTTDAVRAEDGTETVVVRGLCIFKSDDPEGIWFDEATIIAGREKLKKAGLR